MHLLFEGLLCLYTVFPALHKWNCLCANFHNFIWYYIKFVPSVTKKERLLILMNSLSKSAERMLHLFNNTFFLSTLAVLICILTNKCANCKSSRIWSGGTSARQHSPVSYVQNVLKIIKWHIIMYM